MAAQCRRVPELTHLQEPILEAEGCVRAVRVPTTVPWHGARRRCRRRGRVCAAAVVAMEDGASRSQLLSAADAAARRDALPLPLLPCSTAHSTVLHAVWVACAAMQYAVCAMQYAMRCNDEGRWDERQGRRHHLKRIDAIWHSTAQQCSTRCDGMGCDAMRCYALLCTPLWKLGEIAQCSISMTGEHANSSRVLHADPDDS